MSASSRIGVVAADGAVTVIYLHDRSYLYHAGQTLLEHYGNEDRVNALMALGDLSSLAPEIGERIHFEDFAARKRQVCAYHRDRNESWADCRPETYRNRHDLIANSDPRDYAYHYLFERGEWSFTTTDEECARYEEFAPLTQEAIDRERAEHEARQEREEREYQALLARRR